MKKSCLAAGGIAAVLLSQSAVASEARIAIKLPSCPAAMTLRAPEAFEGAVPHDEKLKAYQPFMFADTQTVFVTTAPKNPDVALLVVEPDRVREVQGTVTPEQFAQVKEAMLKKNPSGAVLEANQILQDKNTSIDEYDGIVQSSTENSATVTLVLDGTTTGAQFTSLTGFKMMYAEKCLVGVILIAPKPSVARSEFEEMIGFIALE